MEKELVLVKESISCKHLALYITKRKLREWASSDTYSTHVICSLLDPSAFYRESTRNFICANYCKEVPNATDGLYWPGTQFTRIHISTLVDHPRHINRRL